MNRAGAVHLFADDRLYLAQDAQAERQPRIDARGEAPDEARAQHQAVAHDLGLGRYFLERTDEKLGGFHGLHRDCHPRWAVEKSCGRF